MKKTHIFNCFFALLLGTLLFVSCKEEEEDSKYVTGTLTFDLPAYTFRNTTYTVTASGITKPAADSVTYTFKGTYFTPDSIVGQTCQITTPDSLGYFALTLAASAPDYTKSSTVMYTTVLNTTFAEIVENFNAPETSITDPRDGQLYYYRTYGRLDWFVQNLHWTGAGLVYGNADALGYMLGSLYTWEQAMTGLDQPATTPEMASGLASGPQGVCPPGWSVPTAEDWADLAKVVSGKELPFLSAWDDVAEGLCLDATFGGSKLWKYHPYNEKTNTQGWSAIPAGYAISSGHTFTGINETAFWWSSYFDQSQGCYRYIHYANGQFPCAFADTQAVYASVRCVRAAQ